MKIGELNQRVQKRLEQEQNELEQLTHQTLQNLQTNLSECASAALATTGNAISDHCQALSEKMNKDLSQLEGRYRLLGWAMLKGWLCHLLLALALLIGLVGGSWVLTSHLVREVKHLRQEVSLLEQEKREVTETLAAMQSKSWGLTLHSGQNGRFIVLPLGSNASTGWTMGKQTAIKLE